jgi:1,4-dihydroxy-6-naphthoate synthase
MNSHLTIGFSPCPNDTYIFYALVHGLIPLHQVSFAPPILDDVETLNSMALKAKLDVTKLSFHALGHVLDDYVMLSSGAALGRGCGPLLVSRPGCATDLEYAAIAIPGTYTTAAMLLRMFAPRAGNLVVMRFEEIMPAVLKGKVDAGVIIHESRFTYQDLGLVQVQDLGEWWEELTGLPLPLGCIAARRNLPGETISDVDRAIGASIQWARNHPDQCMGYIRQHAQEMQDNVLQSHISLYVNDYSLQIGDEGKAAVGELLRRGREAGIFPENRGLDVFGE